MLPTLPDQVLPLSTPLGVLSATCRAACRTARQHGRRGRAGRLRLEWVMINAILVVIAVGLGTYSSSGEGQGSRHQPRNPRGTEPYRRHVAAGGRAGGPRTGPPRTDGKTGGRARSSSSSTFPCSCLILLTVQMSFVYLGNQAAAAAARQAERVAKVSGSGPPGCCGDRAAAEANGKAYGDQIGAALLHTLRVEVE